MRLVWIFARLRGWAVLGILARGLPSCLISRDRDPRPSVAEIKGEFAGIMKGSALHSDFRSCSQASQEIHSDPSVVRFTGRRAGPGGLFVRRARIPWLSTYSTAGHGNLQRSGAAISVTSAVLSAMAGGDFAKADLLLGRALGRGDGHEVMHILSKSGAHGHTGVAKSGAFRKPVNRAAWNPEHRTNPRPLRRD